MMSAVEMKGLNNKEQIFLLWSDKANTHTHQWNPLSTLTQFFLNMTFETPKTQMCLESLCWSNNKLEQRVVYSTEPYISDLLNLQHLDLFGIHTANVS